MSLSIEDDSSPPSEPSQPSVSQNGVVRQNAEGREGEGGQGEDNLIVNPQQCVATSPNEGTTT